MGIIRTGFAARQSNKRETYYQTSGYKILHNSTSQFVSQKTTPFTAVYCAEAGTQGLCRLPMLVHVLGRNVYGSIVPFERIRYGEILEQSDIIQWCKHRITPYNTSEITNATLATVKGYFQLVAI
jgi:hypothetical protein